MSLDHSVSHHQESAKNATQQTIDPRGTPQSLRENILNFFSVAGPALTLIALSLVVILLAGEANAAGNDDWVKPGIGLIETLQSGLVTIGALVVGLAVVGFGIYSAASSILSGQPPQWGKLFTIIIAGVLIMSGPQMMSMLLQAVGSA